MPLCSIHQTELLDGGCVPCDFGWKAGWTASVAPKSDEPAPTTSRKKPTPADLYRQALAALDVEPVSCRTPWGRDQAIKRAAARDALRAAIAAPEPSESELLAQLKIVTRLLENEIASTHGDKFGAVSELGYIREARALLARVEA